MEKPNRAGTGAELAEARERIEALTGLLDAIAALADQPPPAQHNDPAAVAASQKANDSIAIYACDTSWLTTGMLRDRTETVAERAAQPVRYPTSDDEAFGTVRAAYLAHAGQARKPQAEPAPAPEPEAGQ